MKIIILIFLFLLIAGCNKPKTVLICGDHICINKAEAKQYFEENLSLEVKIIDKKIKKKNSDLVELNLEENQNGKKMIRVTSKKNTNKNLKVLSKKEKKILKKEVKNKKLSKKNTNFDNKKSLSEINGKKQTKEKVIKFEDSKLIKKKVDNKNINVADVCTIIKKCSIDEISKYLINRGKNKNYPDLTKRQ